MRIPQRDNWPAWSRALTSGWVLSPLLAFALVVGAFFAYGAYTRSQPTHYSRGGDFFAAGGGATGSDAGTRHPKSKASEDAGKRTAKRPGGKTTGASATVTGTRGTTASHGTRTGESSSAGSTETGSQQPAGSDVVLPRTGTYTLDVSGGEHVKFGPFSACSNTFPSRSQLVVSKAEGEPTGSYDFDQRFYPSNANKHDERHIYRYGSDGVFLSYEQATVTCGGMKQSSAVSYSPLQQRVPASLDVGTSWRYHGGDSKRTEDGSSEVIRTEQLTVDGTSYPTYVIDTHLSMSGDESGSRDRRIWWSPALGIALKWHESLSGKRSGASYSEDVTCTVVTIP